MKPNHFTLLCLRIRNAAAPELFELERELADPDGLSGLQRRHAQDLLEARREWLQRRPAFPEIAETVSERKSS